jgi:hypothetical protein
MTSKELMKGYPMRARIFSIASSVVLACILAIGASMFASGKCYAAEQPYTYDVVVYAGNGSADGAEGGSIVYGSYGYGSSFPLITNDYLESHFTPDDSRYYVKGVRLAGHDELLGSRDLATVTEDVQLVVAYGLKKDQVQYTVNYVDTDGNKIAESKTFWGNVGDMPVIAHQYIEGYQPINAKNMTGQIKPLPDVTEFTFEYAAVDPASSTSNASSGSSTEAQGDNATAQDSASDQGDAAVETEDENAVSGSANEPVELLNIDDEENPLAGIAHEDQNGFSIANILPWVLGVLVAAALVAFIVLMVLRKKQRDNSASV